MAKYTRHFKLQVIRKYLNSPLGYKSVAHHFGLNHSMVRRWVISFEAHGNAGIGKKFTQYDAQFKHRVLRHMWDHELSYGQAAVHFNIRNPACISLWERRYHSGGIDALTPRPKGPSTTMSEPPVPTPPSSSQADKRSREELLDEIESLRAEVAYLKKLEALVQAKKQAQQKKRR